MMRSLVFLLALASAGATLAAESPQDAFVNQWEGRTVTVEGDALQPDLQRAWNVRHLAEAVCVRAWSVATPSQGTTSAFGGRQGRDDVIQHDLHRFVDAVNRAYEPDGLDVRSYRKLEAVALIGTIPASSSW